MTTRQPEESGRGWTIEDYLQREDGLRCELLDGELVRMSPVPAAHQYTATRIGTIIDSIAMAYDLGICFDAPTEVMLSRETIVQPDLTFFAADYPFQTIQSRLVAGIPELVVEITCADSIARDRGKKRGLYAEAGIPWLILVDYKSHTAETYHCSKAEAYAWQETASANDTLEFPPHPELSIDLSRIWPPDGFGG